MIKVVFKNAYENEFGDREYCYKDYDNAKVGDIVVVNTCRGYAIAKVTETDVVDINWDEDDLKTVEKVIKTKEELDAEEKAIYEKRKQLQLFAKEARKVVILNELKALNLATPDGQKLLDSLSLDELEKLYNSIKK
jgi:hypothetical protein